MLPDIFLTNTLTGKKETFTPIEKGTVKIYSCGPTVYDFAHIGNFRSFLMSDILFRVLKYAGYEVTKVQNITDVGHLTNDDLADASGEDKMLKKAKSEKKDPFEIARYYEDCFVEDEKILRILPPNGGRPRATDFIPEQIEICKKLIDKDFAYKVNGSVYFRTAKFEGYGKLSKNKLKDLIAGTRVEVNSEKEDPLDFALWKHADEKHLMQWDFNTGNRLNPGVAVENNLKTPGLCSPGFPGWHIECSAMSAKIFTPEVIKKDLSPKPLPLTPFIDIHTGGEDNIFPHHECEIAQNECAFNGKINYWLHGKHLLVEGKKMSKSKGNFYTIRDLLDKGWLGNEIRYALMSAHYRTSLNFSEKSLQDARASIKRLDEARRVFGQRTEDREPKIDEISALIKKYKLALFDDLNIPEALATTFEIISLGHKKPELQPQISAFLENDFDQIFDIFSAKKSIDTNLEKEIEIKIEERDQARADKNWELSDQIRDELAEKGIELIDKDGETSWKIQ